MEGGTLTTAGNLVIHGTYDGRLLAWSADSGKAIGEWKLGTGIMAAPSTYEVNGQQYIAVNAGYGGAMQPAYPPGSAASQYQNYGRLVAFTLGGTAPRLPAELSKDTTPTPPTLPALASANPGRGERLFLEHCAACHSGRGNGQRSAYPDLHRMTAATHARFDEIVRKGALRDFGMAPHDDVLSETESRDIHAFLLRSQAGLRREEQSPRGR